MITHRVGYHHHTCGIGGHGHLGRGHMGGPTGSGPPGGGPPMNASPPGGPGVSE
ncbi:MAG: hypothetical protein WBZ36_02605 [Candidatus Nitrosopolaris sp.]